MLLFFMIQKDKTFINSSAKANWKPAGQLIEKTYDLFVYL